MSNNQIKNSLEEKSKDYIQCTNIINEKQCNGKWFQYKAKEDKGYCKACIKVQLKKYKGLKFDKHRN